MRRIRNGILCLLLATVMLLSGCTGGNPAPAPGDAGEPSEAPAASEAAEAEDSTAPTPGSDDPKYSEESDLALEQAELDRWDVYPEVADGPTYDVLWWGGMDQPYADDVFGIKLANEVFNINLIPVLRTGDDALRTLMASGEVPDFMPINNIYELSEYYNQGIIAPLDEALIQTNIPSLYKDITEQVPLSMQFATNMEDGAVMGVPKSALFDYFPISMQIRADWLEAVGIDKVPSTLDELEEAFRRFRNNDPDGNGQKDTYALSSPSGAADNWGVNYMFQSIFTAHGILPAYWKVENDQVVLGLNTPAFVDALELLGRWYAEELIDPEFITDLARSSQLDVAGKFAEGRIGYLDHLNYDDIQWDNDGQLSAKWMANQPAWYDWFMENADDPEVVYATSNVTDFSEEMKARGPYYITMPPVTGPYGTSGTRKSPQVSAYLAFGRQVLEEEGKLERIMFMHEKMYADEDLYSVIAGGPPGIFWDYDAEGKRVNSPDASLHAHFHPQHLYTGTSWWICPLLNSNPALALSTGDEKKEQRFERAGALIADFPTVEQALQAPLPTAVENPDLLESRVSEYIVNSIIDGNVRETYDEWLAAWMQDGGEQILEEANAWYQATK